MPSQLSESLIPFFVKLKAQGIAANNLYFVRGPGSFMALKLIYLFAKTMQITHNSNLFATHGFYFNSNSPIKAYGNSYFVLENNEITLKTYPTPPKIAPYTLPQRLNKSLFTETINPLYLLPPV
ncbi:hypothetical protein HCMG_00914 [Helicobacter canadensis MIT 98-5491]|nr:hypothetical protein HCMG_00914 [Helicobacter canadensis MIT 98-5491]